MNYMRTLSRIVTFLAVVSVPVLFISISVHFVATSEWFYERGFDTYNIARTTGIERPELVKGGKGLIEYFKSNQEPISIQVLRQGQTIPLFNEREIAHLKDVKDLFKLTFRLGELAGIYLLGYFFVLFTLKQRIDLRSVASLVFQGSLLTMWILILLGVGSAIDFQKLFVQFHVISFQNDLWMLDPSKDYLIMMFPTGFWIDATIAVALATAVVALVAGGVAYGYLRRQGRKIVQRAGMAPK